MLDSFIGICRLNNIRSALVFYIFDTKPVTAHRTNFTNLTQENFGSAQPTYTDTNLDNVS